MRETFFSNVDIPVDIGNGQEEKYVFVNPATAFLLSGNIYLTGVITEEYALNIIHQLRYLQTLKRIQYINIYIDNHGGFVHSAFTILNTMSFINKPIRTINMGIAYSAAAVILSSGTKGERYAYPNSKTLIHCAWTGGLGGKEHEIEEELKDMKLDNHLLYELLSKNTGKSYEFLKNWMREDRYLTAQEAKKMGLIDKIVTKSIYKKLQA